MGTIAIDNDIMLAYVRAQSFPDGVMAAHENIKAYFAATENDRRFYGLSRPENDGGISYKAAAEVRSEREGMIKGLHTLVLKKGRYLSIVVQNFMQNMPAIGNAIQQILAQPGIDPEGYCVELYPNDNDVQCMVRLEG